MAMSRLDGGRPATERPLMEISPEVIGSKPGDGVEQSGLAAARGTDEHQEAALVDLDVDVLEDLERAVGLAQVGDFEKRH